MICTFQLHCAGEGNYFKNYFNPFVHGVMRGDCGGVCMNNVDRIRRKYEKAVSKKRELVESLKQTEKTDPTNLNQIWIIRDQIAYWEGMSEGLSFALEELGSDDAFISP